MIVKLIAHIMHYFYKNDFCLFDKTVRTSKTIKLSREERIRMLIKEVINELENTKK